MADHAFANAGLGMFGSAEKQFAQKGMSADSGKGGGPLGNMLAGLLKNLTPSEDQQLPQAPAGAAVPQFEPASAFPAVNQQQYLSPYTPAYTAPVVPPSASPTSLQGFKAPPAYQVPTVGQPQSPTSLQGFMGINKQPQVDLDAQNNMFWGRK